MLNVKVQIPNDKERREKAKFEVEVKDGKFKVGNPWKTGQTNRERKGIWDEATTHMVGD